MVVLKNRVLFLRHWRLQRLRTVGVIVTHLCGQLFLPWGSEGT